MPQCIVYGTQNTRNKNGPFKRRQVDIDMNVHKNKSVCYEVTCLIFKK